MAVESVPVPAVAHFILEIKEARKIEGIVMMEGLEEKDAGSRRKL